MSDDGNAMRCWFASLLRNQSKVGLASLKIPDGTKETEKASTETSPLFFFFFFFFPLLRISVNIFKERFAKREGTKSCIEWAGSQSCLAYGACGDKNNDGGGVAAQLCLCTACGLGTCGIHLQTWEGSCIQTVGTRGRFPGRWRKVPAASPCGRDPICMWGPLNLFTGHFVPGF